MDNQIQKRVALEPEKNIIDEQKQQNPIDVDEIVRLAAIEGARAAIDQLKKEEAKRQKKINDRRAGNTKLLLKNYRDFKAYASNAKYRIEEAEDAIDYLDLMWDPHNKSELVVESIKASAIKTSIIMAHIDGMIECYRRLCYFSHNELDERRFNILYDRYIADDGLSMQEIAVKYCIDERTAYMDLNFAIQRMTKLVFGIDYTLDRK